MTFNRHTLTHIIIISLSPTPRGGGGHLISLSFSLSFFLFNEKIGIQSVLMYYSLPSFIIRWNWMAYIDINLSPPHTGERECSITGIYIDMCFSRDLQTCDYWKPKMCKWLDKVIIEMIDLDVLYHLIHD